MDGSANQRVFQHAQTKKTREGRDAFNEEDQYE